MKERIKTEFRSNTAHYLSLFVLFLTGFGLRLYYLITTGVENDEIFSYTVFASRPLSFGLTHYDTNNHPLNTLLVHLTTKAFGNGLLVIRFWVFLCGIAVLPLLYLVIRRLYNKEAALLGIALAVPPTVLINYTVNARGYGLQISIFLLLILVALRIKETGKGWFWYITLTVLGFYAVLTFIYCIGVVFFWLLFSAIFKDVPYDRKRFTAKLVVCTVVAGVVTGLAYLPFIVKSGLKAITENPFVKSLPAGSFLRDVPTLLNNIYHSWSEDWWVWLMPLLIAGFMLSIICNRRVSKVKVSLPLVMVGWFLVVFFGQRALVYPRVIVPFYPIFLGCSAVGLYFLGHTVFEWARKKKQYEVRPLVFSLTTIVLTVLMIINIYPKVSAYGGRGESSVYTGFDYKVITKVLKTRVKEGDVVYGDFFMVNPLTYEFVRAGIPLKHLYKNIKNVRTISPENVKRAFIITDIAHNSLLTVLDYTGLEYNDSYAATEYLHGDAVGAKNTLFEILVVPVARPATTKKLETSFKPIDERMKETPNKVLGMGKFFGVYMLDETHAWAVGKKGTVAFYNGKNWKTETIAAKTDLTGVYAKSPNEIWVVGVGGTAFRYDGKWSKVQTPLTTRLMGISGVDSNHIWAVGMNGGVIFFDGQTWSMQDGGVSWNIKGVSTVDSSHVWAVGSGGILFFDGQKWSVQWQAGNSSLFQGLNGVYALDYNHVWAVGSIQGGFSSSVLFFDGRKWVVQFDKFGAGIANIAGPGVKDCIEPLKSVYASSPDKVYAVTEQAVVICDGNQWHIRKAPNEFYSALSGFENKVVGVGWRQEHNNLTNRTIYEAAVFNSL